LLVMLAMLLFGSLIWFAERGTFIEQGEAACPQGASCVLRQASGGQESSPSPFTSIPVSFWWVLVTITSEGYGDHFPVTPLGYVIGTATILFGSVVLALPIGIIATAFSQAYVQIVHHQTRTKAGNSRHMQQAAERAQTAPRDNHGQPPAVFVDFWRAVHRAALIAGIPLKIADAWKTGLFEVPGSALRKVGVRAPLRLAPELGGACLRHPEAVRAALGTLCSAAPGCDSE